MKFASAQSPFAARGRGMRKTFSYNFPYYTTERPQSQDPAQIFSRAGSAKEQAEGKSNACAKGESEQKPEERREASV